MGIKEPEIRFVTPGGDRMVIVPEALFDRLVEAAEAAEDAEDEAVVAAWNERETREETWPLELIEQLAAGANPIRAYRRHRGLSQSNLATATGLSNAYLSEIETGKQEGSLDARRRIAAVLAVTLDDLEPWTDR